MITTVCDIITLFIYSFTDIKIKDPNIDRQDGIPEQYSPRCECGGSQLIAEATLGPSSTFVKSPQAGKNDGELTVNKAMNGQIFFMVCVT